MRGIKLELLQRSRCISNAADVRDAEPRLPAAFFLHVISVNISAATGWTVNLRGTDVPLQIRDQQNTVVFVQMYESPRWDMKNQIINWGIKLSDWMTSSIQVVCWRIEAAQCKNMHYIQNTVRYEPWQSYILFIITDMQHEYVKCIMLHVVVFIQTACSHLNLSQWIIFYRLSSFLTK